MSQLLRIPQVARMLDVPQSHIYKLIREGLFPAVHLGRIVRVDETSLKEWIARGGRQLPGGWRREDIQEAAN